MKVPQIAPAMQKPGAGDGVADIKGKQLKLTALPTL